MAGPIYCPAMSRAARVPVIDSHVHIGPSVYFHFAADGDALVREADRLGIDRIFCTDTTALFYEMREGNDRLAKEMKRHRGRILGYCSVTSPRFGKRAVDEVRRCVEVHGMRGLKLYSYPEACLVERWTWPVLEASARYRLPTLIHATPAECEAFAREVPEAIILMAHMGGHPFAHGEWWKAIAAAKAHKNTYLDTASSQIDNGMLETAVEELGPEKILFGSDMPLLDAAVQMAKVEGADIPEAAKRLILGGNMERLLKRQTWHTG